MVKGLLSGALAVLSLSGSTLAAPKWETWGKSVPRLPVVDNYLKDHGLDKKYPPCTPRNLAVRKDFDSMAPQERKAFTDAINCIRSKPSNLDHSIYSGATDRFMDYATVHVNRTQTVHLSGFFLTWHRYYLHLFEKDLRETCGYTGSFPYWNWPATADNLHGSPIFDGSEYSMSGDGYFTNNNPIVLAPTFSIPHGSGGGCIQSGPFAGMNRTMADIPTSLLVLGGNLPPTAFTLNSSCLTRDLNTFAAQNWVNYTVVQNAVEAPDMHSFEVLLNGVVGGGTLGVHSGAHFVMGAPASNIFVSAMDPIWYPLHTMLDRLYVSWQLRHPDLANQVDGTLTANNLPPSPNATIDTIHPNWGYFQPGDFTIGEFQSTTAGPFCYTYDVAI